MQITRGYRTELDLNNKQITLCKKHAGVARFSYNWGLKRKQEVYRETGRGSSAMDLHRELNALKQSDFPWMLYREIPCQPLVGLPVVSRSLYLNLIIKFSSHSIKVRAPLI
jgi:hypothetical protein